MSNKKILKLKDYEKLVPSVTTVTWENEMLKGKTFGELSYAEKIKLVGEDILKRTVVRTDGGAVLFGKYVVTAKRNGKRLFVRSQQVSLIYLTSKGGRTVNCSRHEFEEFFGAMGIRWIKDIVKDDKVTFILSKIPVLKSILTGTIHSEESLWKFVEKRIYGVGGVDWRVFRDYHNRLYFDNRLYFTTPIADLRDFTENTGNSMKRFLDCKDMDEVALLSDLVADAVKLNETVNLGRWSISRIKEHHKRQVRELMKSALPADSEEPFYEPVSFENAEGVRLLGSVSEVFEEGALMSHCLYTNYLDSIKKGKELAFHLSGDEECTFAVERRPETVWNNGAVTLTEPKLFLQQVYQSHNRPVSEDTRKRVLDFIAENRQKLEYLLQTRSETVSKRAVAVAVAEGPACAVPFDNEDDLPF